MIQSMTGFGKASGVVGNKKVTVEIKSVNSKQMDLNLKIPSLFREKEIKLRTLLSGAIGRGKAECLVYYELLDPNANVNINTAVLEAYLNVLKPIASQHGLEQSSDLISSILRFPEITRTEKEDLLPENWVELENIVQQAIKAFLEFRKAEGQALQNDLFLRIDNIDQLLEEILPLTKERVPEIRSRLNKALDEWVGRDKIDENRFEQELIYYLEKLDVTEEEIRLKSHLDYFRKTSLEEDQVGKKLGFISQELGREINTLGSKANHSEIQQKVVRMKDELEKIKEQVLNVC